jgi:hypothetical protein
MALFGFYTREKLALCTEYKCRQLVLKSFDVPNDILFQELGNSTPFMRLSFIVFVLPAWRSLITWRAAHLFRSVHCMDVFKPHNMRQRYYIFYGHLSGVNKSETPCCSAFVDKCAFTELVKKIPALLESDCSLQCSSKTAIWTYPEPL